MKKVGAKDVTELPGKIADLIRNRDSSGGKLGSENAALKQTIQQHEQFLNDLGTGKPEAIEFLTKKVGYVPNGTPAPNQEAGPSGQEEVEFRDTDEYLDPELATHVRNQDTKIQEQAKQIERLLSRDKERDESALTHRATTGWVDNVVGLVTSPENQKVYGLSATEARGLAEQYFNEKKADAPIHPKFQKVHELLVYANKEKLPTLEAAHVMHQYKSGKFAQDIVAATKNGQQNFTPSVNSEMSDKQSRQGNNLPEPTISDDDITRMERGDFEAIPDSWTDEQGNFIPNQVPQRFHDRVFGRAGKPRR
jgi:hypothetical protein